MKTLIKVLIVIFVVILVLATMVIFNIGGIKNSIHEFHVNNKFIVPVVDTSMTGAKQEMAEFKAFCLSNAGVWNPTSFDCDYNRIEYPSMGSMRKFLDGDQL